MKEIKCPYCKFISDTFPAAGKMSKREYWIMTEIFVYLHSGKDYCYESNYFSPTIMNGSCCNQPGCQWYKKFVCTKDKSLTCIYPIEYYEKHKEVNNENTNRNNKIRY